MQQRQRVRGKDLALAASTRQAHSDVVCGVFGSERLDAQAGVNARVQGAIAAQTQAVLQIRQADEDQRKERLCIPLIVRWVTDAVRGLRPLGFRPPPPPNPACTFRYAPGSPSIFVAKSGSCIQLSLYCSTQTLDVKKSWTPS